MIDRSAIPRKVISEVCAFCFPWICLPAVVEQVPNRYPKARNMNTIKDDLIAEIDKRVADKILEPANAELLKKLIRQADNDNEAMSIAELGTTYKRTGLHFDKRLERMTDDICYFKKNEALSFHTDDGKPVHKLIIGDNYQALQNLMIQYKGKIDVIYIDPPYGKDSMGEFAQTNYENAITRDNLLSMLYPRLMLAKMLLSDSGVIYCSIDDRNQAYVKCLFDEVFGEMSFVATIPWRKRTAKSDVPFGISQDYEWIMCYGKEYFQSGIEKETRKYYETPDFPNRPWRIHDMTTQRSAKERPNCFFTIINPKTGEKYPPNPNRVWANNEETFKEYYLNNRIIFPGDYDFLSITKPVIRYWKEDDEKKSGDFLGFVAASTDLPKEVGMTLDGTKDITSIFGDKSFGFPKPVSLIQYILRLANPLSKKSIILDFFAGSGTTGHAVLELNKKDEGNRTFILCQLNEKTDTTPNSIAYDVTAKRLKRIMTGECYDGTKDFKWIKENQPYGGNLDVYDLATVANFADTEGKTPFEVIDETLYGQEKFQTLREKVEWVCGNFSNAQKTVENDTEWQKRIVED